MKPWQVLDRLETREGPLELRRRADDDFLITVGGRVLMTSTAHRSEDDLAQMACAELRAVTRPRVLVGGLGMGFTLRSALDHLPPAAEVVVVELSEKVVDWCRGPLAHLTARAIEDRRVKIRVANVAHVIAESHARFDAIIVDLYEGPHHAVNRWRDPLYGMDALKRTFAALKPGGVFAVWSEEPDKPFEGRLEAAGFEARRERRGQGGRTHVIYLATARPPAPARRGQTRPPPQRKR